MSKEDAKKLGLEDLGYPVKRVSDDGFFLDLYKNIGHKPCRHAAREGRTDQGKVVYWCPRCKTILRPDELFGLDVE